MYAITVVLLITMQLMFINLIVHRICDYEYKAVRCILVNVISVVVLSDAIIIDKGLWCLIAANVLVFLIFAFAMSAKSSVRAVDTKDNYIEYNDDCYSCHIAFTKNMTLTSGGARKDVIDSTFYFVKYEGRWAIADMIATTK